MPCKTGTITEGTMEVTEVLPLHDTTNEELNIALGSLIHALEDDNPTFNAVKTYCDQYDKLTCNHIGSIFICKKMERCFI